jgi:FtsP/CotA-like multicopper oxidase with cupredoxin domain
MPPVAVLLLSFIVAAAGEDADRDESNWQFFLKHHPMEWIKQRPELPAVPELEGICEKPVKMSLSAAEVTDPMTGEKVMTRAWNGAIPGPTFRVHPGCTIDLTIYNELESPSWNVSVAGAQPNLPPVINGSYAYLNTTNIHVHGLHVSPDPPSDSIFMRNDPGTPKQWIFKLPENHMGGTHWYHPHLHHATASQAGGGAAGMIIVEEPKGSLPPYVEKMEEKILIFLVLDFQLQASIEKQGLGTYFWQTKSKTNTIIVNGVHQPKVTVQQGKWYRFRMLFSAIEMWLQMTNKGDAWCSTKLLAKDGVWLDVAPRDLTGWGRYGKPIPIQLGPANRADIAIACTCPFPKWGCYTEFYSLQNCTDEKISIDASDDEVEEYNDFYYNDDPRQQPNYTPCNPLLNRRRRACEGKPATPMVGAWGPLDPPKCGFGRKAWHPGQVMHGPGLGNYAEDMFQGMKKHGLEHGLLDGFNGTIFSVVVEPTWKPRRFWSPAWKFSVRRPCYLVDMRKAVVKEENIKHVEFWGAGYGEGLFTLEPGPIAVAFEGLYPVTPPNITLHPAIGNVKFVDPPTPPPYGPPLPMGEAIEWFVGGVSFHPFHLHITPYQIVSISGTPDDWLQPGDWQDTLLSTLSNCDNNGLPCPAVDQQWTPPGAPAPGNAGNATVRFWTDQFPGQYISHCHLLTHEDEGMMFYMNVSGPPGKVPAQAQQLDPTCYTSHLKGWGYKWRCPLEDLKEKHSSLEQQGKKKRNLRSIRLHDLGETEETAYLQRMDTDESWEEEEEDWDLEDEQDEAEL